MSNKGKYYVTTAIAYTSGKPHIGNTYEIILADSIARYRRQEGYDVFFQTGTDEHGQKIELKAQEAGVTPKEFVDKTSAEVRRIWDLMNTSYDKFIRTTDETTRDRSRRFSRNCTIREISTRVPTRDLLYALRVLLDRIAAGGRQMSGLRQRGAAGQGGGLFLPYEQICGPSDRLHQ
mgnify:CR=1 FL=1